MRRRISGHSAELAELHVRVDKMRFPEKAYQYVVNGKSAIEWVMERYQVSVHKDSGIENCARLSIKVIGSIGDSAKPCAR